MKRFLTALTASLALVSSLMIGSVASAQATSYHEQLHYYGANLQAVVQATGAHLDGNVDPNGPWPQFTPNYCFVAVVQALVNYNDIMQGRYLSYPHQSDQGPVSGNPNDAQTGQILWDMDHLMIPPGGPLVLKESGLYRRPFTLGNIAYDFGGDPRIQAFATNYEAPAGEMKYHEHIYHTNSADATLGMAKALARYSRPVLVLARIRPSGLKATETT